MKILLEIIFAVVLHPVAVILVWINLAGRRDMGLFQKVLWGLLSLIWGIGPLLYVFLGGGDFW
jgi:hypothetical protein